MAGLWGQCLVSTMVGRFAESDRALWGWCLVSTVSWRWLGGLQKVMEYYGAGVYNELAMVWGLQKVMEQYGGGD